MTEAEELKLDEIFTRWSESHTQKPSINLIKWLIGTFGVFVIGLAFTAGAMFWQFNILKDNMIPAEEWRDNDYKTDHLWNKEYGIETKYNTRGGVSDDSKPFVELK